MKARERNFSHVYVHVSRKVLNPTLFYERTSLRNLNPLLALLDATMIVAGSMIGSGIFIVSADMMKDVGSAGWLVFAWVLTACLHLPLLLVMVN